MSGWEVNERRDCFTNQYLFLFNITCHCCFSPLLNILFLFLFPLDYFYPGSSFRKTVLPEPSATYHAMIADIRNPKRVYIHTASREILITLI